MRPGRERTGPLCSHPLRGFGGRLLPFAPPPPDADAAVGGWRGHRGFSGHSTELALFQSGAPAGISLADVGGIVIMLKALDPDDYTWNHDAISATPEVPYLAYEEWDTAVVEHPQGFDVQIGGPADADCSADFGGPPQPN